MAFTANIDERLSYSRFYTFMKCRRAYGYQYVEKLYPKSGTVSVDAWIDRQRGTVLHAIMEALFTGRTAEDGAERGFKEATEPKWREKASQDKRDALTALLPELIQVGKNAGEFMRVQEWEPLTLASAPLVELEISWPIAGWKNFYGKPDLVAIHKPSGLKFVIDHKSTERFGKPEDEKYRLQLILYCKVLRELGVDVHGAGVLHLKPDLPKRKPRKQRVDEGRFDAFRESIDGKFQWTPTLYSETYQDRVWAEFEKAAKAMAAFQPGQDDLANMGGFSCGFCDHRILCQAELNDHDADYIREAKYRSSAPRKGLTVIDL